ncbi:hypothetical protein E8E14_008384 [Neopestalotiopsis sp. 37M]|nr:hypothetical protein E8E14_008384 [Neopestalotiopsis sp. 37M]
MDALAALGIACNLMQVISFAGETITLCKHVYKRGSADPGLEENAKTLRVLVRCLDESLHMPTSEVPPDQATVEVQALAKKCLNAVSSLSVQLNEIGTSRSQGRFGKTIIAVSKYLRKASDLRHLQEEIEGYQRILDSGLLIRIYKASEAAALHNREDFKNLNTNLQHFIGGLSKNQVYAFQLIQSVDTRVGNGFLAILDEGTKRRVLRSLKYEGINHRRNTIKKPHRKTFEWIFRGQIPDDHLGDNESLDIELDYVSDHSITYSDVFETETASLNAIEEAINEDGGAKTSEDHALPPWDDFIAWLQSDDQVYWVSGKPGSGKSTFMLFLLQDARTKTLLDKKRPNTRILSHFLLSSGPDLQRSVKGIYCSLLHQILEDDLGENGLLLSILTQKAPKILSKDDPSDWKGRDLEEALEVILEASTKPTCIFIDGLDEVIPSEIDDILWNLLASLQSFSQVKICLSSRPEPMFQMRFDKVPKLRIHTLTQGDIQTYARHFWTSWILPAQNNATPFDREEFVRLICERSDGVFLWVRLVLGRLLKGLVNGDSIAALNERLEQMPKELHDLFNDMWSRLGQDAELTDYISTAATYFRLVDTAKGRIWPLQRDAGGIITVADMMLATDHDFRQDVFDGKDVSPEQIDRRCDAVIRNLETRCAGFLECYEVDLDCVPRKGCEIANQTRFHKLRIQFIHRSALEYLQSTPEGLQILEKDTSTYENRLALLCQVDVAVARLWGFSFRLEDDSWSCLTITKFLDRTLGYGFRENTYVLSDSHRQLLAALGGYIYTNAGSRSGDFFAFYTDSRVSTILGSKPPDFIMVLSQTYLLGLVPIYLTKLYSLITPEYLGYLVLCICNIIPLHPSWTWGVEMRSVEQLIIDIESVIKCLIENGADINIRGLSTSSLRELTSEELNSSCYHLDTPVSVLILNLYRKPRRKCLL